MLLTALIPLVVMAALWPGGGQPAPKAHVDRLSDHQLVGQRIVVGFSGHGIPDALRGEIRDGTVAGVILFSENFSGASDARALIAKLQAIPRRPPLRHTPLLVMLDQEGGLVKRLPGPPAYSAEEMGSRSRATCHRQGRKTGRYLRDVGVNVDLAPVLDVARPGSAIGAQHRSFGGSAGRVRARAVPFAAGLQDTGVAATAKHFPGLGAAPQDTDFAVQRVHVSKHTLRHVDERPYRSFQAMGGSMVMLDTAIYPAFHTRRPAAFSHRIATVELRKRLGFNGVSITDALETTSVQAVGGPARVSRLAAGAGADLLLFTDLGDGGRARHALARALAAGHIGRGSFERSAARVLDLRAGLGG